MPNRRVASGIVVAGRVIEPTPARLTERALAAHDENMSGVHPFLHNFTSPIGASLSLGGTRMGRGLTSVRRYHGRLAEAVVREAAECGARRCMTSSSLDYYCLRFGVWSVIVWKGSWTFVYD